VLHKWRREKPGKGDKTMAERGATEHPLRYLESLSNVCVNKMTHCSDYHKNCLHLILKYLFNFSSESRVTLTK